MTFIDFFAGLGGFTAGLTQAGFQCIGFCEKDKFAIKSYQAIHLHDEPDSPNGEEWFCDDIKELESSDIPYADGWTAGFPCQDISVSGKQSGLNGQRSGLFFEIIRLIKGKSTEDKPRWILLENVKNLLGVNGGRDFTEVLYQLSEAGYDCEWQLINSKVYVPQSRDRIFIIAHLRNGCSRKVFPIGSTNTKTPIQLINGRQGSRVYDPSGLSITLTAQGGGCGGRTGLYFIDLCKNPRLTTIARCILARYNNGVTNRNESSGVFMCARAVLTPDRINKRQNGRRIKECGEPSYTITCQDRMGVMLCECEKCRQFLKIKEATAKGYAEATVGDSVNLAFPDSKTRRGRVGKEIAGTLMTSCTQGTVTPCGRIRKLTPLECFRLQGFTDEMFYKAQAVTSDNQLYKQIGNSVTIPVIYEIGRKLKEVYDERNK